MKKGLSVWKHLNASIKNTMQILTENRDHSNARQNVWNLSGLNRLEETEAVRDSRMCEQNEDDVSSAAVFQLEGHEAKGQVTIHVQTRLGGHFRIWPSIKLRCLITSTESSLIQVVGLSPFPNATYVKPGGAYTLLFETLPSDCLAFDLIEDIPQSGGLIVRDIARNKKDVYRLRID